MKDNLVIHELFDSAASGLASKIALKIKELGLWRKVSYGDLNAASVKIAIFLLKKGLKKGDRAAIIVENGPEWPIAYLGIMRAGLTCVPLDPKLTADEIWNLLKDSGAKTVFCSRNIFLEKIQPRTQDGLIKIVMPDLPDSLLPGAVRFSDIPDAPSGPTMALPEVSP
ncbi:MAG: AMP-binding protein, partial [Candidatus Omnitrophica bacterium]|nr:AMP-binding protein [Candidatus Omnitrophota bacterium]